MNWLKKLFGGDLRGVQLPEVSINSSACVNDACTWPLDDGAWKDSILQMNWPKCTSCGIALIDAIDFRDAGDEQRGKNKSFQQRMSQRHQRIFEYLVSGAERRWPDGLLSFHWRDQMNSYFGAEGKRSLLELPVIVCKADSHQTVQVLPYSENIRSGKPQGAPVVWPIARLIGWQFWWKGGTDEMRRQLAKGLPFGVSFDYIWHGIGLEGDFWIV